MKCVECPNCHLDFLPVLSVNMFTMDATGKPQKGWVVCTECKETVLPEKKTPTPTPTPLSSRLYQKLEQKDLALEACMAIARTLRQHECYPKNENYDKPLGTLTIDLDKIRTWMRGLGRDLGSRVFSNPDVLREVFGYENWYAECCTFSK